MYKAIGGFGGALFSGIFGSVEFEDAIGKVMLKHERIVDKTVNKKYVYRSFGWRAKIVVTLMQSTASDGSYPDRWLDFLNLMQLISEACSTNTSIRVNPRHETGNLSPEYEVLPPEDFNIDDIVNTARAQEVTLEFIAVYNMTTLPLYAENPMLSRLSDESGNYLTDESGNRLVCYQ